MYFIFNASDESLVLISNVLNSNYETEDYLIATYNGEFEEQYNWTYDGSNIGTNPKDPYDNYGRAIKGDPIVIEQSVIDAMEADAAAVQYQSDRKNAYPSIVDQLDALFHAGVFPEEMAAQIQAVKDAYPKPE
jgi:hypothetical protein